MISPVLFETGELKLINRSERITSIGRTVANSGLFLVVPIIVIASLVSLNSADVASLDE